MHNKHTLTETDLQRFTGDLERFRHPFVRSVIYTPGVKCVAERGGAYWLIDELAFAIAGGEITKAGKREPRVLEMHFWRLTVNDQVGELTARADSDIKPFFVKGIDYTDFPLDKIDIWAAFDGEHWTLYLPSEH
jgi:hypothetical protein